MEKKDHEINFRCTESEKKRIISYAKEVNLSTSEYLIRIALKRKISNNRKLLLLIHALSASDNKLENNINQIARKLNSSSNVPENDIMEFIEYLRLVASKRENINQALRKIIKLLAY